ncbi:MAG: hypothetical protein Kow00114_15730 [Kiloniellaceae bacterium]
MFTHSLPGDKSCDIYTSSAVIAPPSPHTLLSPSGLTRGSMVPLAQSPARGEMDCRVKPGNDSGVWTGLMKQPGGMCDYRSVKPRDDSGDFVRAAIQVPEALQ